MKSFILSVLLSTAFATSASASEWTRGTVDTGLLEPVTFMRCRPAHPIYDGGQNVLLQHERVGSRAAAVVERISIMGAERTVFHNLSSRPLIVQGDMAVGTIYEAREDGHFFQLVINFSEADGNAVSPAQLRIDGMTAPMACQSFMTIN